MDKVQRIDRSNAAPSSKTFRDELPSLSVDGCPVVLSFNVKAPLDVFTFTFISV
jgi:hypothetical protein